MANAFLAQRISSINSISMLCEEVGASCQQVSMAAGQDSRIGSKFLRPSVGFGGSCFQKDILNLVYLCEWFGLPEAGAYWEQVVTMNNLSKKRFVNHVLESMFDTIATKKIAVFGFAYKKDTGDTRDTPAVDVCRTLLDELAQLYVYDPKVTRSAALEEMSLHGVDVTSSKIKDNFIFVETPLEAICGAHAILILTEWDEFSQYDYKDFLSKMKSPSYIFDGRNILSPTEMFELGFEYHGIGHQPLSHLPPSEEEYIEEVEGSTTTEREICPHPHNTPQ